VLRPPVANPVAVQIDGPRVHREATAPRRVHEIAQNVSVAHERARTRLDREAVVAGRVGSEVADAGLEEAQAPARVVRKQVASLVVDRRERDAADASALLDVREHRIEAFALEVGGEGEEGGVHGCGLREAPERAMIAGRWRSTASASWEPAGWRVSTSAFSATTR
jgi:hypothetical protein